MIYLLKFHSNLLNSQGLTSSHGHHGLRGRYFKPHELTVLSGLRPNDLVEAHFAVKTKDETQTSLVKSRPDGGRDGKRCGAKSLFSGENEETHSFYMFIPTIMGI